MLLCSDNYGSVDIELTQDKANYVNPLWALKQLRRLNEESFIYADTDSIIMDIIEQKVDK